MNDAVIANFQFACVWLARFAQSRPTANIETSTLVEWTWPPQIVIPLCLYAIVYLLGIRNMFKKQGVTRLLSQQFAYFALGCLALIVALDSPIHELGEKLFWVHMTQHEILMLVAAPLFVLSRPLVPLLNALPIKWRDRVALIRRSHSFRAAWTRLSAPLCAWLISALALWTWHVPWLFDRTLHSDWVHAAQHSTFFGSALLFWWPLANGTTLLGYGEGVAYVFTTALHTSILGALLTFAPRAWYESYLNTAPLWHLTALEDQQIGGLIMWIPAGTILVVVGLVLLVKWMNHSQTRWQYTRMAELSRLSGGAK